MISSAPPLLRETVTLLVEKESRPICVTRGTDRGITANAAKSLLSLLNEIQGQRFASFCKVMKACLLNILLGEDTQDDRLNGHAFLRCFSFLRNPSKYAASAMAPCFDVAPSSNSPLRC
jgi:hypothetical protein